MARQDAATNGHVQKVIAMAASTNEKDRFMGSLIRQYGSGTILVKMLVGAKTTSDTDVPSFIRDEELQPIFYTRKHICAFVDDPDVADVVVYVAQVEANELDITKEFKASQTMAVKNGTPLVVVVDDMQKTDWNCDSLRRLSTIIYDTIKEVCGKILPVIIVSEVFPWLFQRTTSFTVIQAIEHSIPKESEEEED